MFAPYAAPRVVQIPDTRFFPPEMRGARVLTLDDTSNLHSVYRPGLMHTTGAYWDALALLPALVPPGPIALLGLGAGTVAHLMHAHHPDRVLRGWELDGSVVALARMHMGMAELEDSGALQVVIGDALVPPGERDLRTAAGVIVDLFSNGQLLPQLEQPDSWSVIRHHLAPGGRVMANLGAAPMQGVTGASHDAQSSRARTALAAMAEAFDGATAAVGERTSATLPLHHPPDCPQVYASVCATVCARVCV
jgi:spermidine synthase